MEGIINHNIIKTHCHSTAIYIFLIRHHDVSDSSCIIAFHLSLIGFMLNTTVDTCRLVIVI